MMQEGKGEVAPTPIELKLWRQVIRHYENIANQREQKHRYKHDSRAWQRGLVKRPTLTGLIAEWGVATYLNHQLGLHPPLSVDEAFRHGGDGGIDFRVFGLPIQVKGRRQRGGLLIRRQTEDGRILALPWWVCVFVTWIDAGEGQEPNLSLTLDGWVKRKTITNAPFVPARIGNHMNLELPEYKLEPMRNLVTLLENWRDRQR